MQLAAAHADRVAAIVLVETVPCVAPPEIRAAFEAVIEAIEAGNQEPRRELIANLLFLPTSDRKIVGDVLSTMMAAPSHVAASVLRGSSEFDGPTAAAQCKVPALHLASDPALDLSQWLPDVVKGVTVGAGHFNMLEAPDQVNAMIEGFLRHHV